MIEWKINTIYHHSVHSLIKTSPQHAPDFVLSRPQQNKIGIVLRAGFNQTALYKDREIYSRLVESWKFHIFDTRVDIP